MNWVSSAFGFIPSVWPVVQRELRARARKPRYYWMRVLGGGAALFLVYKMLQYSFMSPSMLATVTFIYLDVLLVTLILAIVPAMTSDCLSREKREGTLGLLFLTPLTPAGIVIGKCVTQALLAWSLWLSVLPAIFIPFLMGGLTWQNLLTATVFQFCAVIISLAAGLLASCVTQRRNLSLFNAMVLTFVFASILLLALPHFVPPPKVSRVAPPAFGPLSPVEQPSLLDSIEQGLFIVTQLQVNVPQFTSPAVANSRIHLLIMESSLAMAILVVAIWIAARHIRKTWQDKPPTVRQQRWAQRFGTVLFQNSFRRKMQHSLDHNPIEWLQQYTWKARIIKWGLCLLFLLVELYVGSTSFPSDLDQMMRTQTYLLLVLAIAGTITGIGSFRSEKESGALELILITPLNVNQIILGRVIGWWKQFLPAALILLLCTIGTQWIDTFYLRNNPFQSNDADQNLMRYSFAIISFLSLPFFAVYAALRVKHFIVAVFLTWVGLGLGFAFGFAMTTLLNPRYDNATITSIFWMTLFSLFFVKLTFFLLRHSLSRRIYSF